MSLRDALASAAAAIFNVVEDLCYTVTYKELGNASYDTASGTVTNSETSTTTLATVVDKDSRHNLISDHVDEAEIVLLILAAYIPGITPKIDHVVELEGVDRVVVDVASDPAKIVWELGLK